MAFSKKSFEFGIVSLAALGLMACGDDSGNGFAPTNGDQVGSIYELGQCSAEREGISVLVTGENTYYLCTSSEWKPVAEYNGPVSSSTLTPSSSSTPTEDLGSSSSVKDPEQVDGSSSSVIASEAKQSSSSVVSSSSVTSSSSVESSSSSAPTEDPSSSSSSVIASSSGTKQSSSSVAGKPAWQYLNPDIDYGEFTDSRDGQVYKTVTIGTQTWMAENLNYAPDPEKVSSMGSYAWSGCYKDKADSCAKYGRLYTWEAAMDKANCAYGKKCNASLNPTTPVCGVCPQGWHLPSHYEFEELINYIDPTFKYNHTTEASSSTAGQYLKSKSGWNSNGNGTDAYGFSALPGGSRDYYGDFHDEGFNAYFWSSGEYDSTNAFYLILRYSYEDAGLRWRSKYYARSVRCLQD